MREKPLVVMRAESWHCPFCAASPGQPCKIPATGRPAQWPHSARLALAEKAVTS